jgi:hypothetical protein
LEKRSARFITFTFSSQFVYISSSPHLDLLNIWPIALFSLELFPNKVSKLGPISDRAPGGAVGDRPQVAELLRNNSLVSTSKIVDLTLDRLALMILACG